MPVRFDSPERTGLSMGGGEEGGSGGRTGRPRAVRRCRDGVVSKDVLVDGGLGYVDDAREISVVVVVYADDVYETTDACLHML
jgi:hypothetical protein